MTTSLDANNGTRPYYGLTAQQIEALLRPIKPHRVLVAQGQSHLPMYDVDAHLTRIFGFAGWDTKIISIELVEERNDVPGKKGWFVTYRCHMRLTIKNPWGNVVKTIEDVACGSASNLPLLGDAHDFAYKNARSYALKRCAKDLGDQFGLSLYNKGSVAALVGTTLVGQQAPHADPESFAPVPVSLGNDERELPADPDTGEITGGAGSSPNPSPAASPASPVRRPPPGRARAQKGGDEEPRVEGDRGPADPAPTIPPAALASLRDYAVRKGLDDDWLVAQAGKPLDTLTEAESQALTTAVTAHKVAK
jgi:hypothetical protein